MMKNAHQAYDEAEKINRVLDKTLRDHPPTAENLPEWRLYQRTVQSSLTLLNSMLSLVEDASPASKGKPAKRK
jgi:hypothetical protein